MELKMAIPDVIRQMSKDNNEYIRWVRSYFKSSHPHLELVRIEKQAVLKKK